MFVFIQEPSVTQERVDRSFTLMVTRNYKDSFAHFKH